jgi:hypothetical protein
MEVDETIRTSTDRSLLDVAVYMVVGVLGAILAVVSVMELRNDRRSAVETVSAIGDVLRPFADGGRPIAQIDGWRRLASGRGLHFGGSFDGAIRHVMVEGISGSECRALGVLLRSSSPAGVASALSVEGSPFMTEFSDAWCVQDRGAGIHTVDFAVPTEE